MGSGLSQLAGSEPAPDTYAAKMERERKSREASRREGLRSRAEEQRFAIDQSQKLYKKDKFSDAFDKTPHKAGRIFKSGNSPLPIKKLKEQGL